MKICYLNCLYSKGRQEGGIVTYMENVSKAMADRGHDVVIVTSGPKGKVSFEGSVKIVSVGKIETFKNGWQVVSPPYLFRRIMYMLRAASYIRKYSFDVVESTDGGFEHLFLTYRKNCPVVVRANGLASFRAYVGLPKIVSRFVQMLEGLCLLRSDGIISPTRSYWDYLSGVYKIKNPHIAIIPNGIRIAPARAIIDVRKNYGLQAKKVILYCGTLEQRKGFDILLRLAQRLSCRDDIVFVVLGKKHHDYKEIEGCKNILYLGHRASDEVFSFYKACDLFITLSRLEAGPLNVIESIVCGKPILGSNVVGVKDEVEDGKNGLLFDIGNEDDLYVKFNRMIDDPELLENFGKESRRLAEKYDIHNVAQQMEKFYREVISARSCR